MVDGFAMTEWGRIRRKRLDVMVAFKDAERGRPLTPAEKAENLRRWIEEEPHHD